MQKSWVFFIAIYTQSKIANKILINVRFEHFGANFTNIASVIGRISLFLYENVLLRTFIIENWEWSANITVI
jgi:hypothetical protein